MLDHLRSEALALIATSHQCILSTAGPAGVQASLVAYLVRDTCVYIGISSMADHLFNPETKTEVRMTTALWQLRSSVLATRVQSADRAPVLDAPLIQNQGA